MGSARVWFYLQATGGVDSTAVPSGSYLGLRGLDLSEALEAVLPFPSLSENKEREAGCWSPTRGCRVLGE